MLDVLLHADASARGLARGWVDAVEADGTVHVHGPGGGALVECDRLVVAEGADLRLARGDVVLYWEPGSDTDRGVVLGRLGPSHAAQVGVTIGEVATAVAGRAAPRAQSIEETADHLVLEAKESLTLRVGDGSITLRADGKVIIEGKDLVSHAQRLNRIKGGAVSIN